jgi:proline racemase
VLRYEERYDRSPRGTSRSTRLHDGTLESDKE